jgi:hypothetical protein
MIYNKSKEERTQKIKIPEGAKDMNNTNGNAD